MSDVIFSSKYYWAMKLAVPDLVNFQTVLNVKHLTSFAHKTMKQRKRTKLPKDAYQKRYGKTGTKMKFWDMPLNEVADESVHTLGKWIQKRYGLPIYYDGSYLSLLELNKGDTLPPHLDDVEVQSGSIIVQLIGGFILRCLPASFGNGGEDFFDGYLETLSTDPKEVLDSIEYYPRDVVLLNNSQYAHSGDLIEDYKLSMLFSVDPKFNLQQWSHDKYNNIS